MEATGDALNDSIISYVENLSFMIFWFIFTSSQNKCLMDVDVERRQYNKTTRETIIRFFHILNILRLTSICEKLLSI